jgi:tRNA pseudouridine55 synthase
MVPQIKNGILNIDKPQGITSHDVVDIVRKIFPGIKVGHTGTLDPIATGVLPICIGKATKLSDEFLSENKVYKVKMLLGVETDTYDITGKIVFANTLNEDEIYIKERIKRFIGKSSQIPPIYSAIKIKGKKAYEYARNGENVSLKPREIEIFNIDDIDVNLRKRQVSFVVSCTKGTYIRSLVHDIGIKLGCGATMIELKRLKTGDFDINDSIDLYEFLNLEYLDMLDKIVSIEELYKDSKKINLKDKDYDKFLNGIAIKTDVPNGIVRVYENLRYKGLGKVNDNLLKRFIIE